MPRLVVVLGRSIIAAPVPREALVRFYLELFGGSANDWRLSSWTLLRDFAAWRPSRLWQGAPHIRFSQITPERQAIVALDLVEQTLRHLADVEIPHAGDPAPRPPTPALLPWIRGRRLALLAQLQQHEQDTCPIPPRRAAWRQLEHALHVSRAPRDTPLSDSTLQES